ncbi:MAG: radical SAM protein [bacterium]|nr:radical SAM protein [bacterium]
MTPHQTDLALETPIDREYHQLPSAKSDRWASILPSEYWHYRHKWEENPKHHIVGTFPLHLDIEATSACNLKCTMCPRTDMIKDGTFWKIEMFDFELYKRLIDEGVQNGLCSIKYNILGEPILNARLIEMIQYAKQAGVIDVMFNTNATRLDEALSRQLIASGLDQLFFSVDSPNPDHFNRIRVGADFDQVLANIKRFMAIRTEMGVIKPFTRVSMVIMQGNEHEWQACKTLFEPIVDAVGYGDYLDHTGQSHPDMLINTLPEEKQAKFCCPQLWQRMFVHPDGVVTVCCVDSARTLQVGNVFEQSAQHIWLGEPYQRLRELHATGRFEEIPTCAQCPLSKLDDEGGAR